MLYKGLYNVARQLLSPPSFFKYGLNYSPMYRRTTGRIVSVSEDLKEVKVKLPFSYRNMNMAGTIFGGSLFAAVDPISMVQLNFILGKDYIIWDKSAEINFKIPAKEDVYIKFIIDDNMLDEIKETVSRHQKHDLTLHLLVTNEAETKVFCVVNKVVYIAEKEYYMQRKRAHAYNLI
ncbi:PaaI family thioesterase [Polluticaenibacter yanchengensis]|uniref:YiiD C-terminal domain-containing protein n=1 Tax=Polluticaenibacter yanchengensis TaxID=3014562 RepID=A0ABT4UHW0_9BACT|nr:YiiD C-terminal domain-containing protein [Chitinophagaceae bacterium LY-5]